MRSTLGKKAAIAAICAAAASAIFAGTVFAAPVLQPGTTSAPGMSGTCTNCHTYAKPAAAAKPAVPAAPKVSAPSRTYVAKGKHRAGQALSVWGFISPRLSGATESTLTVYAFSKVSGSWVTTSSLTATGTISPSGKFKHKDNYATSLTIANAGKYRLRTELVFVDAKGVQHDKWSKVYSIRIYK
jgi:hypothetical protein